MTTQTDSQASFISVLNARRSVRHYDPAATISDEQIKEILEIATRAPSSSNTQSWRFLVVTDPELKQQMLPIANNQQQVVDAAAVIVVLGDQELYTKVEQINNQAVDQGFLTREFADRFTENSVKMYSSIPKERLHEITVFDAGLVSMQIMLAAKEKGYDTVPMGGYDREKLKALLNIPDRYALNILLPIGKPKVEGHPSARLPVEEVTFFNKI